MLVVFFSMIATVLVIVLWVGFLHQTHRRDRAETELAHQAHYLKGLEATVCEWYGTVQEKGGVRCP